MCIRDRNTLVQAALFVGVSFAALLLTRPLVKKFSTPKIQRKKMCIRDRCAMVAVPTEKDD